MAVSRLCQLRRCQVTRHIFDQFDQVVSQCLEPDLYSNRKSRHYGRTGLRKIEIDRVQSAFSKSNVYYPLSRSAIPLVASVVRRRQATKSFFVAMLQSNSILNLTVIGELPVRADVSVGTVPHHRQHCGYHLGRDPVRRPADTSPARALVVAPVRPRAVARP